MGQRQASGTAPGDGPAGHPKGPGAVRQPAPRRPASRHGRRCPLKKETAEKGIDLMMVRELTGGIYFGKRDRYQTEDRGEEATDLMAYSEQEIERIGRRAFELARLRRNKVSSVDKANVLETSRLWRKVMHRLAEEYSDVSYEDVLVDNCAMQLVRDPASSTWWSPRTCSATSSPTRPPSSPVRWACCLPPPWAPGPGPVRAHPRFRARHRRSGQGQSSGHHPVRRHDAASGLRPVRRSRRRGECRAPDLRDGFRTGDIMEDAAPWWLRRDGPSGGRTPVVSGFCFSGMERSCCGAAPLFVFGGRGKALLRRSSKGKARPLVTTATDGGKGGWERDGWQEADLWPRQEGKRHEKGPGAAVGVVRP